MQILIDDVRDIENVDIIFRNGDVAVNYFSHFPHMVFDILYMDHDLGCGLSGYQTLLQIIEDYQCRPKMVYMVTSNPVGRDNMAAMLLQNGYKKKTPETYVLIGVE